MKTKIALPFHKSSKVLNVSEYSLNSLNISLCVQQKNKNKRVYSSANSTENFFHTRLYFAAIF